MGKAFILVVERARSKRDSFAGALKRHYEVLTVPSGKQAVDAAKARAPQVVILDAASMRSTGERIAKSIKAALPAVPLIHLLEAGAPDIDTAADIVLRMPFTARKVLNAIARLLHSSRDDDVIVCGPFSMKVSRRVLIANGQETQLTPKLASLVEMFLRRPGEVLAREMLMKQVWNTDYMGDTRTLDVHIRWIRRAIETDPGKPVYLKTIRGVGYRLEVETNPSTRN